MLEPMVSFTLGEEPSDGLSLTAEVLRKMTMLEKSESPGLVQPKATVPEPAPPPGLVKITLPGKYLVSVTVVDALE